MEEWAGVEEAVGEDKDDGEWGAGRMSGTRSGWWWCSGDGGVDGAESGPPETRAAGQWRPTRWGDGESGAEETRTMGRRRGGGAAASGEERGRGSRARAQY